MLPERIRARITLIPLLVLLIGGPALGGGKARAQEGTSGEWPMIGRDSGHSGSADGPTSPYRVAWRVPVGLGGPIAGPVVAAAAVVVVADRGIAALDPATGEISWSAPRAPGPAGPAAIADETVIHSAGEDRSSTLVARTLADGRELWRTYPGSAVAGGPVIEGDLAYVGTREGALLGFDLATGRERFRFEADGAIESPPAVAGGLVMAAWEERAAGRATVRAVDVGPAEDRAPAWQVSSRPGPLPTGVVSADRETAFVGAGDGSFRALGLDAGDERWAVSLRNAVAVGQVPAAGPALVVADRLHVARLDPGTGEERWAFRLADLRLIGEDEVNTLSASAPAVSGDAVITGDATGLVSAIDLDTGHRVWRQDLGTGAVGPAAVTGDTIHLTTLGGDGVVAALEHDPAGRRLDEVSVTVLSPLRALLNFLLAAVVVTLVILGVFRYALGGRRPEGAEAAE